MPSYEFECLECKNIFVQTMTIAQYEKTRSGVSCPKCKSKKVEQRLGARVQTSKKS